jgi:hypothetical protein
MGVIYSDGKPDYMNYIPEYIKCPKCGLEIEKHIVLENARFHVLGFGAEVECNAKRCEYNHKCKDSDIHNHAREGKRKTLKNKLEK